MIKTVVGTVIRNYGRIDILINNAGYSVRAAVEEINMEKMQQMFETNVFGIVRMIQAVAPYMRQQNCGKIINIGSVSGRMVGLANGGYCATKHAVNAISETARYELQSFGISETTKTSRCRLQCGADLSNCRKEMFEDKIRNLITIYV